MRRCCNPCSCFSVRSDDEETSLEEKKRRSGETSSDDNNKRSPLLKETSSEEFTSSSTLHHGDGEQNRFTISMPPPLLEFGVNISDPEVRKVFEQARGLFQSRTTLATLKNIKPSSNCRSCLNDTCELKRHAFKLLAGEESLFEEYQWPENNQNEWTLLDTLHLNRSLQNLLLASYVWDQRLDCLRSAPDHNEMLKTINQDQVLMNFGGNKEWVWFPLSEIHQAYYMNGILPNSGLGGETIQVSLGDYMAVQVDENQLTSPIAADQHHPGETPNESPNILLGEGKQSNFSVVCIYEKDFRDLRSRSCPSEIEYIASLSRCKDFNATGGKSGSHFLKTKDERFIVKQIKDTEYDSFIKFAQKYFTHVKQCSDSNSSSSSCLARIFGIYQVTRRQNKKGKGSYNLMVMENIFFGRKTERVYDLKGVKVRHTDAKGKEAVYWDKNFIEDQSSSPLVICDKTKQQLKQAVLSDTTFLTSADVMDYSLLVGIDQENHQVICGIIDYLRQYTLDKCVESFFKSIPLVLKKDQQPTVIPPKEYEKRFKKFMSRYLYL